ncbi:MAG: Gfo/Idh/MocA family oxidoreductase [Oscillospiraceae bacterium]|nr:Gfo/Idh/MocA family oxidoreductase [Oscillospiraceae bacterium]
MRTIQWGIIGTGRIARKFAEALGGCEGAGLCAVSSRTAEKAQAFAQEYGFRKAYGSYEALAQDTETDVVYIATPMHSHYHDAKLCLLHDKNVLCEKSVTLNAAQLAELLALAKERGLFFMEAMWMKCRPVYRKALAWLQSGKIGQVRYLKADFSNFVPYRADDRLFRADCGGGALLDLGVYPLTLAYDVLGMPQQIVSNAALAHGVDISNSILLRYPCAYASLESGFELGLRNNALISGTDGLIQFGDVFHCTDEVALLDKNGNTLEVFHSENRINGYEYEIEETMRCLADGLRESPLVPQEGTRRVMEIMDICRRQWGLVFPDEISQGSPAGNI